jgi:hypothetical protein
MTLLYAAGSVLVSMALWAALMIGIIRLVEWWQ